MRRMPAVVVIAAVAAACSVVPTPTTTSPAPTAPAPAAPARTPTGTATPTLSLPTERVTAAPPVEQGSVVAPRAADDPRVAAGEQVRFTAVWEPAADPAALAERIARTEAQVRDAMLDADVRASAAAEGQHAHRQLARTPAWRDEVLAALPERWHAVTTGNLTAATALTALRSGEEPPDSLPAWEIVAPAPAEELLDHYAAAAADQGVGWEHLAAINLVETRMGRIRGFSTAGARGPMQFIPASWEAFGAGGDIDDDRDSIFAAARHLRQRGGDPFDTRTALFNYNNSVHYVDAVEAYAAVLREDPDAYLAYHGWQVYYVIEPVEHLLPVGYREPERVPLAEYLARPAVRAGR